MLCRWPLTPRLISVIVSWACEVARRGRWILGEGVVLIRLAFSEMLGKSSPSICLRLLVEIFSSCLQS